jgi:hypothetical protein
MRQDKIVARIILIFSIANAVLAAPAVVRQRSLDHAGDKSTDESVSSLGSGSGYLPDSEVPSDPETSSVETPSLISDDHDTSSSIHPPPAFDTDHYYSDQLSESHFDSPTEDSWDGSLHSAGVPASGPQQLNDPPHTSGRPPSQDRPTLESEAAQLHNPLPGSGDQPLHDNPLPWWHSHYPVNPITSGSPLSQDHPTPESEAAQLHNPLPGSGNQPLYDDPNPWWRSYYPVRPITPGSPPSQDHPTLESEAAQLHNPLPGSGNQPLYDDPNPWWHKYRPSITELEQEVDKVKTKRIMRSVQSDQLLGLAFLPVF